MANAVLAALLGWAVASVFLHLATFRTLLLVVAMGGGAGTEDEGHLGTGPLPPAVRRPWAGDQQQAGPASRA
jgi:hypothetical protein